MALSAIVDVGAADPMPQEWTPDAALHFGMLQSRPELVALWKEIYTNCRCPFGTTEIPNGSEVAWAHQDEI